MKMQYTLHMEFKAPEEPDVNAYEWTHKTLVGARARMAYLQWLMRGRSPYVVAVIREEPTPNTR